MRTLYDYQLDAHRFASDKQHVGLLHEMRLGKTVTTIRLVEDRHPGARKLVVAPLTVLRSWADELAVEGLASSLLHGTRDQRVRLAQQAEARWFLINYEGLLKPGGKRAAASDVADLFANDVVVLDESTRVKNAQAKIAKLVTQLFDGARMRMILTGSPMPNGLQDIYQQMKFLLGGSFMGHGNFWAWRNELFEQKGYDWRPKPSAKDRILTAIDEHCHRLTRKDVGIHNAVVSERRHVSLSQKVRAAYRKAEKEFVCGEKETKYVPVVRMFTCRLTGGRPDEPELQHDAKLRELTEVLADLPTGDKCLVWYYFSSEGRAVERHLRRAGYRVRRVGGDVPTNWRFKFFHGFRQGSVQVLVMQQTTGQYGLDLSVADTAVFYTLADSPEAYRQAKDRLVHPEKKRPLLYMYLLAENTVDEDKYEALKDATLQEKMYWRRLKELTERRLRLVQ